MKKIFMFLAVIGLLTISAEFSQAYAQEEPAAAEQTEAVAQESDEVNPFDAPADDKPLHQQLKKVFIEGGAGFMALVLVCLILGLAIAIERIITLSRAQIDTKSFSKKIEEMIKGGNIDGAIDLCKNTRGPVASVYVEGLKRVKDGQSIEDIEKAVITYGGINASELMNGMTWISLFIGIAPQLGFLGTVIGLIQAFDAIEVAGDISPALVAGGMKVALITTVGGLVVAIILQLFYNYLVQKVDGITVDMEEASVDLIDTLVENK